MKTTLNNRNERKTNGAERRSLKRLVMPEDAHALRPVRLIGDDELRVYEGTTFPRNPKAGCELYYNRCYSLGYIASTKDEEAGLCDILDKNGDIIADFPLTNKGLRYLYRKLKLRVA